MPNFTKRLSEIRSRKAEIRTSIDSDNIKPEDMDKILEELRSMSDEEDSIIKKMQIAEAINSGTFEGRKIETPFDNEKRKKEGGLMVNNDIRNTDEYRSAFLAYMQGKATPEQRAMTTVASGAAIIPTQTFNQVIDNIKKQNGIISNIRLLNVPGKLTIPQSQIIDPAVWHVEGTEIEDTSKDPTSVTLSGFELAKLFSLSVATQSMDMSSFENYLIDSLTYAMGSALSVAVLNGKGPSAVSPDNPQPTGIISGTTWSASNSISYTTTINVGNIVNFMALLGSNFRQNASFIMNSVTLYKQIAGLLDSTGRPIFLSNLTTGVPMSLLGKPIIIDDNMPDDNIIFGDPTYYFMNFSQPMSVEVSREAGFTKGSIIYRAMAVCDGKPVAPAFVKLYKAA